ncbi:MAG: hypothetical protein K6L76_13015 [Agarilytica sp.]
MTEISDFKKAYLREKSARKQAEEILEEKTLEIYATNQELEQANQQLRLQQKNLIKTEKLAAIGQLAAGVAHEINNPLAFAMSNIHTLQKYCDAYTKIVDLATNEKEERSNSNLANSINKALNNEKDYILNDTHLIFSEINEGLQRVKDIVSNLRNFSRTKSTDIEDVDIDSCIASALKMLENKTKYHCKVVFNSGDIPLITCNKNQITQVILNIVVNAAQAIQDQGEITITTRDTSGFVSITIVDTGVGIAPEHIDEIFNPFFTAKPIGEGTGLGLSVSFSIVEDIGGTISVESELGKGSTFTILLPTTPNANDY